MRPERRAYGTAGGGRGKGTSAWRCRRDARAPRSRGLRDGFLRRPAEPAPRSGVPPRSPRVAPPTSLLSPPPALPPFASPPSRRPSRRPPRRRPRVVPLAALRSPSLSPHPSCTFLCFSVPLPVSSFAISRVTLHRARPLSRLADTRRWPPTERPRPRPPNRHRGAVPSGGLQTAASAASTRSFSRAALLFPFLPPPRVFSSAANALPPPRPLSLRPRPHECPLSAQTLLSRRTSHSSQLSRRRPAARPQDSPPLVRTPSPLRPSSTRSRSRGSVTAPPPSRSRGSVTAPPSVARADPPTPPPPRSCTPVALRSLWRPRRFPPRACVPATAADDAKLVVSPASCRPLVSPRSAALALCFSGLRPRTLPSFSPPSPFSPRGSAGTRPRASVPPARPLRYIPGSDRSPSSARPRSRCDAARSCAARERGGRRRGGAIAGGRSGERASDEQRRHGGTVGTPGGRVRRQGERNRAPACAREGAKGGQGRAAGRATSVGGRRGPAWRIAPATGTHAA